MAENLRQNADGSAHFVNTNDSTPDAHFGGPATPTVSAPRWQMKRVMKVPLAAGVDTAGGILSWQNTLGYDIIVDRLIIDVTAAATAACSASAGQTATNGTTSSANLIDTLDVHTAAGTFDNVTDKGANGKSRQKIANGKWLTISTASGASAGLAGYAYLAYWPA